MLDRIKYILILLIKGTFFRNVRNIILLLLFCRLLLIEKSHIMLLVELVTGLITLVDKFTDLKEISPDEH